MIAPVLMLSCSLALASNYPPSYGHQTVRVVHKGPALFANVGSGTMSADAIGYKSWGPLAATNPETIDAVITWKCTLNGGYQISALATVKLGREWNGTGYMSRGLRLSQLGLKDCVTDSNAVFEIAFSDGQGHWDSMHEGHLNYYYGHGDIYGQAAKPVVYETHEVGDEINIPAWAFIIDQMRH